MDTTERLDNNRTPSKTVESGVKQPLYNTGWVMAHVVKATVFPVVTYSWESTEELMPLDSFHLA